MERKQAAESARDLQASSSREGGWARTEGEPVKVRTLRRSSVVNMSAPSRLHGRMENAPVQPVVRGWSEYQRPRTQSDPGRSKAKYIAGAQRHAVTGVPNSAPSPPSCLLQ